MLIRRAKNKDVNFLFNLYNFYVTKKLFSSIKKVKYLDHKKWYKNYVESNHTYIYVASIKNVNIGYVSFKNLKKNIYEVSLALKKSYVGFGLGSKMLHKSIGKFRLKSKFGILAKVKKKNIESILCFSKNNFRMLKFNKIIFHNLSDYKNYVFFKYVEKKK